MDFSKIKAELVQEFDLEGIEPAKQEELLEKIMEALLKQIFVESMEKLGEENAEEYMRLIEREASEEEVARFLEAKIPNYEAFIKGVVDQFKAGLKAATTV